MYACPMTTRTALVAGATGLVGGYVKELLLDNPAYGRVTLLVRRAQERSQASEKARELVVDFEALAEHAAELAVDDVYACLGTTIKVAGSQEKFRRVDHDYTVAVAELAKKAGATRLALVSSVGATEKGGNFYLRVKGETERDVAALGYATVSIARPSLLVGPRKESRPAEAAGIAVARALAFTMVGGLRGYRPIEAKTVAAGLVRATLDGAPGVRVLQFAELTELAART
jgi:uncharacterized protein YbjT (DUF2867 family)